MSTRMFCVVSIQSKIFRIVESGYGSKSWLFSLRIYVSFTIRYPKDHPKYHPDRRKHMRLKPVQASQIVCENLFRPLEQWLSQCGAPPRQTGLCRKIRYGPYQSILLASFYAPKTG